MEHRDNTVGFFWWSGATGFAERVGRRRNQLRAGVGRDRQGALDAVLIPI